MASVDFSFEGLLIERIIAHRVFPKSADKSLTPPKTSKSLMAFKQDALDAFQVRITEALASKSHGIEMSIGGVGDDCFLNLSASTFSNDTDHFIKVTERLASKLSEAQYNSSAPGGILAVLSGRVGNDSLPFLAVIKAETQNGFRTVENDDQVTMEFIAELLLTPAQRFYKIGFIVQTIALPPDNDGNYNSSSYRAFLFDHLMTSTETKNAAGYFYSRFLDMDISKSSKKLTQDFFESTRDFINTAQIEESSKLALHEALRSEMRSRKTTLSTADFAETNLPEEMQSEYLEFMKNKSFPAAAVTKDNGYIESKLKIRSKLVFSNDVWVSVPPDQLKNLVEIIPSDDNESTTLKIKGRLKSQQ
ncbi:nucleoid-associated protein [Klebsiella michiganensis]|uniref:nucleoid-associated protein n=2 Tax=Klebsiella michiganensis TaxID=1134687 RepID=UPI00277CE6A9|nr:nucleoid-associated protein [Klebsiella michiganensis]HDS8617952.1 nucleoid-associated protein [Klebsiella michiganensis]